MSTVVGPPKPPRVILERNVPNHRGTGNARPTETSKFGKGRTVSLHPDVARDLERYLRGEPLNYLLDFSVGY